MIVYSENKSDTVLSFRACVKTNNNNSFNIRMWIIDGYNGERAQCLLHNHLEKGRFFGTYLSMNTG